MFSDFEFRTSLGTSILLSYLTNFLANVGFVKFVESEAEGRIDHMFY